MIERLLPRLSSEARTLLAKERLLPADDDALRRRVLERARASLEADRPSGVGLQVANVAEKSRGGMAQRRHTALLLAAALAVAGLAAAGAGALRRATTVAPGSRSSTPISAGSVAARPKPPADTPSAAPDAADAPAAEPRQSPTSATDSFRPTNASSYASELELLEPARSSIARGDFQGALSAIVRHQHEYPHGQLTQEREALRVRALWGSGQTRAAELSAAAFRKRYPRSGLLSWMKTTVAPP